MDPSRSWQTLNSLRTKIATNWLTLFSGSTAGSILTLLSFILMSRTISVEFVGVVAVVQTYWRTIEGFLSFESFQVTISLGTDAIASGDGNAAEAVRDLTDGGVDFAFDAIGKIETTEQAIDMLGIGGMAVVVGLPPTGATAKFEPLVMAERELRVVGSNYGSTIPAQDFPALVDLYLAGDLMLDELVSGRRPLEDAEAALQDLAARRTLRTLLLPSL